MSDVSLKSAGEQTLVQEQIHPVFIAERRHQEEVLPVQISSALLKKTAYLFGPVSVP